MKLLIAFGILTSIGLGLGYGSYINVLKTRESIESGIEIMAIVTRLETRTSYSDNREKTYYYPVYQYQFEGKVYEETSRTGSIPARNRVGDEVPLTINPDSPHEFLSDDFFDRWFVSIILGFFSMFMIVPGGIGLYYISSKLNKKKWLELNGTTIEAQVLDVSLNTSYRVNGKNPYRIKAQWLNPRTNSIYTFYSDNLWYDPSSFLSDSIRVKLDINNPLTYYVILDNIPKAA
jgi:hypothetical protein